MFGDITYPINSPLAITLGFAASEASHGNYADAMEVLQGRPVSGAEHLLSWVKAVVYGAAQHWIEMIEEVRGTGSWPDTFLAAVGDAHGSLRQALACSPRQNADSPKPTPRRRVTCARAIAWYLADDSPQPRERRGAVALPE